MALAEMNEAYERLDEKIDELDMTQDFIGDAMCRIKALILEAEKHERLVGIVTGQERN